MGGWGYVAVMGLVTLGTRMLPVALLRRPLTNPWLRSFLGYVPYVTLTVMTVPAIFAATGSPLAGAAALAAGVVAAWRGASLPVVALVACATVLVGSYVL